MGRIRTGLVKRACEKLLKLHRDKFKASFEENKNWVSKLSDISSKKLRNMLAGYITKKLKNLAD